MEIQDLKKVQDAIYQRLTDSGVNVTREELAVDEQTLAKCRAAADSMVNAMETQNKFNNDYSDVSVKIEAGLEVDENTRQNYKTDLESCKQAIQQYSDAHILAHRTEYAAQLAQYRAADASTLKKLTAYRYDRDAVDAVIATQVRKELKEKEIRLQGKNCLLVGRNSIGDGLDQLIESNTHSPIPIKDTVSSKVKVPYGEPMYPMLNDGITQDNNDLRPYTAYAEVTVEEEVSAEKDVQAASPAIKRIVRTYNDEPSETRRRTTIAADILYEEKLKRGIKLSPDPAPDKEKSKTMDKGMQDIDNILKLRTNNDENGSGR